ncbi:hypothetical protein DNR41_27525, partial [Escherichia coli]
DFPQPFTCVLLVLTFLLPIILLIRLFGGWGVFFFSGREGGWRHHFFINKNSPTRPPGQRRNKGPAGARN